MGKSAAERPLSDTEAMAYAKQLRTSPQKLNLVAETIRGKDCEKALAELTFSKRRIAGEVKKVLESAIANAENNHQLDVDRLRIKASKGDTRWTSEQELVSPVEVGVDPMTPCGWIRTALTILIYGRKLE